MDRNKLITIVVTAVITAIVTQLVNWFVSLTKTWSTNSTLRTTVRIVFSRENRAVFLDMGVVIFSTVSLVYVLLDKSPVTRFDILLIILWLFGIVAGLLMLAIDMIRLKWSANRRRPD